MNRNLTLAMLGLPLALALSACGNPESDQINESEEATLDQPGFEGTPATQSEARSEAAELAGHLASGDLDAAEARVALNDLGELINNNIDDFPAENREQLMQILESAGEAFEAEDMAAMQEAAKQIEGLISDAEPAADAE